MCELGDDRYDMPEMATAIIEGDSIIFSKNEALLMMAEWALLLYNTYELEDDE